MCIYVCIYIYTYISVGVYGNVCGGRGSFWRDQASGSGTVAAETAEDSKRFLAEVLSCEFAV